MRRAFVIAWILLGVAGALDQTVALALTGRRFDLWLPHLQYGHVMFNHNPRKASLFHYAGADGVSHDLAELMETPALGYQRARLAISVAIQPDYLAELCLHAQRRGRGELTFTVDEIDMEGGPTVSHTLSCTAHGLR